MKQRILVGVLCCLGLLLVFLFQRVDAAGAMGVTAASITRFLVNRAIRFLVNDALAIGLIYALFPERKYVLFAVYVQLFGLVAFLIPYFVLKVYYPVYNGPYLNFLHRLVMNPTLLMLLIPAFYYQKYVVERDVKEQ